MKKAGEGSFGFGLLLGNGSNLATSSTTERKWSDVGLAVNVHSDSKSKT